jgi:hypothetical protein
MSTKLPKNNKKRRSSFGALFLTKHIVLRVESGLHGFLLARAVRSELLQGCPIGGMQLQ